MNATQVKKNVTTWIVWTSQNRSMNMIIAKFPLLLAPTLFFKKRTEEF
jgi:hypothetical protein